ncbi:unnamed protein product [Urochloa decumbens]|uniref:Proteasome assembly chaperone 3 n=1 Tax=Urochloa decumbens TaxID=240449 RepID=A0ABC9H0L1_9POAL
MASPSSPASASAHPSGSMESAYHDLFRDVCPCVVLVQQVGRIDYFCIGSVIQSEDNSTFILTQSSILDSFTSPTSLTVCFSDGHEQPASLVLRHDLLYILRTSFHPRCKALQLFEGQIKHSFAAAVAPDSSSSIYQILGSIVQKSAATSDGDELGRRLQTYDQSFTFVCQYDDCGPNMQSRLISGPTFNMESKALGIVIGDWEHKHWPGGEDGKTINLEDYIKQGFDLKLCLAASHLEGLLGSMLGDPDWRKALKALGP